MSGLPEKKMSEDAQNVNHSIGIEKKRKLCECGCGKPTKIASITKKAKGHIKGKPMRFVNGHNGVGKRNGENNSNWKGGTTKTNDGRVLIRKPKHSKAMGNGYVLRYVLIAEKALGKPLPKGTVLHHFNEDTGNDTNSNLVACENENYHRLLHQRKRAYDACGHANWRKCHICKEYDNPENLYIYPKGNSGYHRECKSKLQKKAYYKTKDL